MEQLKPKDILKKAREERRITQAEMADRIAQGLNQGYSLRQYQRLEDGQFPKYKMNAIIQADQILGTNLTAIIYDKNVHTNADEQPYQKRSGIESDYLKKRRAQKNTSQPYMVPLVPMKAIAGYVKSYDQIEFLDTLEKYSLPPGVSPVGAVWQYFEIAGDSMEPTFQSSDIVLASQVPFDDWIHIRNFYVYIILTEKDLWIKHVYAESRDEWILISENESAYKPFVVKVADIRELWVMRRHIKKEMKREKEFDIDKIRKQLKNQNKKHGTHSTYPID
jgi:phage repressor protein C with HTH and peptisase S24 domain